PMSTTPLSFDISTFDEAVISELNQDTLIANPTGTARPAQWIRLKVHTTVPRLLTSGSMWTGFLLPTPTTGDTQEDGFLWDYQARTGNLLLIYNSQWIRALGPTGVTPGAHPCPASLTVAADGRITAITDGTLPCGSGGGGGGTVGARGDVQLANGTGATLVDTGSFVHDAATHITTSGGLQTGGAGSYYELVSSAGFVTYLMPPSYQTKHNLITYPNKSGEVCLNDGTCGGGTIGN